MAHVTRSWSTALSVTAMLTGATALAETTATTSPATAPSASVANVNTPDRLKILDRLSVLFFSQYAGPSVGKISDPIQPDEYGRTKESDAPSAQFFDNSLPIMYKLNDAGLVAGMGLNGVYRPFYGQGFTLSDPYIKIGHKALIKAGNFSLAADLRDYLPVSKSSHNANQLMKFRSVQIANYDIPNSKFSINSISSVYYHVYGSEGNPSAKNMYAYINPNLNYQAFAQLGLWTGYEMDALHLRNEKLNSWNNDGTYFYLGASWDATKNLNFTPYLSLRPGGAMNADSTQFAAYLSYKLL